MFEPYATSALIKPSIKVFPKIVDNINIKASNIKINKMVSERHQISLVVKMTKLGGKIMNETKNGTKDLPVIEPVVDLGNHLDLPDWNSNWTVNKAVSVYNSTMHYTFLACMKVCEIIYKAKEWKKRNVVKYKDDAGKMHVMNDYLLFIETIGINEKKADRMSTIYEEYAVKRGLLYRVTREVKELPSSYSILYEIATAKEDYEDNIRTIISEKGAETSQIDIRIAKKGSNGNGKVNGSFKPPEKSHLLAKFYITEEDFEKRSL